MNQVELIRSAAVVLLAALPFACADAPEGEGASPTPAPLVEAVEARQGALPIEETLPGVVRARNQVMIRPEISGRVVEVLGRSGDAVRRGQPLVRLDDGETTERLRAAEADVRLTEAAATAARARTAELEARVERSRVLARQDLVSAQELETLEAQLDALRAGAGEAAARVEQARATVEERRSALAKTVVAAPVAGRLGERRVEVGMQISPATLLFEIGDLDELIVELDLTESMLDRVEIGQPVVIERRDGALDPVRAALTRISPFLAEDSFTTRGEIDVDNRDGSLRPGMFVSVTILVGESLTATLVPISAVWEDPASGQRGVFVAQPGDEPQPAAGSPADGNEITRAVTFRRVEILAEGRGSAGLTGVEEGEWVVIVGQHLLAAELRSAAAAGGGDGTTQARLRPISWERIQELQSLQNEDLLDGFLDKQRKVAAALGAEIPASEDEVDRVLEEAAAAESASRRGG